MRRQVSPRIRIRRPGRQDSPGLECRGAGCGAAIRVAGKVGMPRPMRALNEAETV